MRFMGKNCTGKGITVAIVDSGVDKNDPRLAGTDISGLSVQMGATGHALVGAQFADENGRGTEIAAAVHRMAPDAKILAVKVMGQRIGAQAALMGAGIEISCKTGARVINVSMGTPAQSQALRLRECVANAVENGSVVLAAAHPKGEISYPADIPETVGVAAHPDCPLDKVYFFHPPRFPRKEWGFLSGKFLTHGVGILQDGSAGKYRGSGIATAYLSGMTACLYEAMPGATAAEIIDTLKRLSLVPAPELGYT
jgi:subtilisin family serine protease